MKRNLTRFQKRTKYSFLLFFLTSFSIAHTMQRNETDLESGQVGQEINSDQQDLSNMVDSTQQNATFNRCSIAQQCIRNYFKNPVNIFCSGFIFACTLGILFFNCE